jgi:predicted MFS family arabinose efflux permease
MTSSVYFLTLYLQRVLEIGPALSGVMFLPFALGIVAGSMLAVRLGYHLAPRTLLIGGGLLTAAGFAWLGLAIDPNGTFLHNVLGGTILASVGFGLCLGPVVSTATAGAAPQESGTASALLNSTRQIGNSLGLAVLGTIAYHYTGPAATAASLTDGYALGLLLDASLLVAAILVALVLPRTTSAKPSTNSHTIERTTTP